jgi:dTMP kinase
MATPAKERGLLIVVEGLDRSGKSTQCEMLCKHIEKQGKKAKYVKFPDRTTPTGIMINSYLTNRAQLDDHSVHLLFSANRWEAASGLRKLIEEGTWVVIDRYSYSGAVYSAAKENPNLSLQWAWAPELGLPQPDIVFFLDISTADAAARGGYGEERYENEQMQTKVRHLFQQIFASVHPLEDTATSIVTINAGAAAVDVATSIVSQLPMSRSRTVEGETHALQKLSRSVVD